MTQNQVLPEQVLIPHFGLEKPIIGVEIGVLGASGSVAMLNRMPNLKLYCIDPWRHFEGHSYEAERDQTFHDENYEGTKKRLEEFKERVIILRMTSDEAIKEIEEPVQFAHIDGDHRYVQVAKDIENYLPLIEKGGIISGHDWQNDDIKRAVLERFEKNKINLGEDFLWWVYL